MRLRLFRGGLGGARQPRFADKSPNAIPVDVELVLAVDVSYSMDPDEQALQREGYARRFTSKEFMQALREGANGKIAVTYIEWAGQFDQHIIMPWRLIEGPESADAVAAEIAAAPTGAPRAPRFPGACALRAACSTTAAIAACAA